jgi:hypothetical protein
MRSFFQVRALLCSYMLTVASCFTSPVVCARTTKRTRATDVHFPSALAASAAAGQTLTEATTWKLRFNMRGLSTTKGRKVDETFIVTAKFVEDQGYEPPQGTIQQSSGANTDERLQIVKSYWKLSEDPNDRKDGLWIWGLFKEPLYPYLLLQLETAQVQLSGDDADSIPPLRLYAQINHSRDTRTGNVGLTGKELMVQSIETVKADMFGASSVDLTQNTNIGTIQIQAV